MSEIIKEVVTGGKLTLEFDQDKKTITITTPNNHQIVILDEQDALQLQDRFGNLVTLGANGILMQSVQDVSILAAGKVNIAAAGNIAIESKADCTVDALNITQTTKISFVARANTVTEISASGMTSIKGALVNLN
ncbi:MAG: hypothetical protein HOP24_01575 [Sideroxydans sp.]|nr:hypothetical protein [Sideroxydans sp.]